MHHLVEVRVARQRAPMAAPTLSAVSKSVETPVNRTFPVDYTDPASALPSPTVRLPNGDGSPSSGRTSNNLADISLLDLTDRLDTRERLQQWTFPLLQDLRTIITNSRFKAFSTVVCSTRSKVPSAAKSPSLAAPFVKSVCTRIQTRPLLSTSLFAVGARILRSLASMLSLSIIPPSSPHRRARIDSHAAMHALPSSRDGGDWRVPANLVTVQQRERQARRGLYRQ